MARFILDVNTSEIERVMSIIGCTIGGCTSITCIDETNTAQFHNQKHRNKLTSKQIRNFNTNPHQ